MLSGLNGVFMLVLAMITAWATAWRALIVGGVLALLLVVVTSLMFPGFWKRDGSWQLSRVLLAVLVFVLMVGALQHSGLGAGLAATLEGMHR